MVETEKVSKTLDFNFTLLRLFTLEDVNSRET
jgi:hypothetical protein